MTGACLFYLLACVCVHSFESFRLFRVSDFPENTYFSEMLFFEKENSFKCLVVF